MYDYIFKNALIVDGSGREPFKANVATFAGSIALIGSSSLTRGKNIIDCSGKILCPGFVDMHTHTDLEVLRDRSASARIGQGIVTDITGNCGIGTFPNFSNGLNKAVADVLGEYPEWKWSDFGSWKEYVEKDGIGSNQAYLVSHTALRLAVLGENSGREAYPDEIRKMCTLLSDALDAGAYGFSSGLYYAPCIYASRDELIALLKVVKAHNKIFSVHHRCEGNDIIASLEEVLSLAYETGVRIEISHLKVIGDKNQDKIDRVLSMIEKGWDDGLDIGFDQYPYTYGSTSLFSLLPPSILAYSKYEQRLALSLENEREDLKREMLNPKGWDSIYQMVGPDKIKILFLQMHPEYNGLTLSEVGEKLKKDPVDALFDLLSEETGLAVMEDITTNEENLIKIMTHPLMCFGSDSLYSSPIPHPRSYHSTVEFLSKYVRDKKVLPIEDAIRRMTYEPCRRLGIKDRGLVREGCFADIVLLDMDKLATNEDFSNNGIEYVLVGGCCAMREGSLTGEKGGVVL